MEDIKIRRVFDTQCLQGSATTTFSNFIFSDNFQNKKRKDFKLFQKKLGALKGKYFWKMSNNIFSRTHGKVNKVRTSYLIIQLSKHY